MADVLGCPVPTQNLRRSFTSSSPWVSQMRCTMEDLGSRNTFSVATWHAYCISKGNIACKSISRALRVFWELEDDLWGGAWMILLKFAILKAFLEGGVDDLLVMSKTQMICQLTSWLWIWMNRIPSILHGMNLLFFHVHIIKCCIFRFGFLNWPVLLFLGVQPPLWEKPAFPGAQSRLAGEVCRTDGSSGGGEAPRHQVAGRVSNPIASMYGPWVVATPMFGICSPLKLGKISSILIHIFHLTSSIFTYIHVS